LCKNKLSLFSFYQKAKTTIGKYFGVHKDTKKKKLFPYFTKMNPYFSKLDSRVSKMNSRVIYPDSKPI
jgi:hypothetical protein